MALFGAILYALVGLYSLLVIVRIIIEMVQAFSKQFDPPHWFIMVAEPVFRVTDPPVKALRRLIPPLRLGGSGVGLDVSVIVVFFVLMVLQMLIAATMINPALR
ncbi:YggT family protein [Corynebacterium sp. zg912]|uniref:YggT family protein n=1 Tax=Corynebacterium wankanglinii TaxID=2735136 RepID=A0A7H0K926_9CORY|nr:MULTISPECIES: YggT family protein [Corynebacterium]MBA1834683.1 YggT family protein [Corynebacterium wankanglinii]MBA1837247.1 YggT family protein [Corynebacterium wankanglinii]MCR5928221.1 YggT family protein [Corynebacterium sp. zg912]QNP93792.1 YggT family protein [Corynebacterium wankanglinii]